MNALSHVSISQMAAAQRHLEAKRLTKADEHALLRLQAVSLAIANEVILAHGAYVEALDSLRLAYLLAPIEHEQRLEKCFNTACRRLKLDPAALIEETWRAAR